MNKVLILLSFLVFGLTCFAQVQTGKASFYADKFEGRRTANGEKYTHTKATAAHRNLPFGTHLKVTNLANNMAIVVRVNDRGPFVKGRIIDLSKSAATQLGFIDEGVTDVAIEVINQQDAGVTAPIIASNDEPVKEEEIESAATNTSKENDTPNKVEDLEFYELAIKKVQPDWYGVQIGSFQELANLIRLADNLKASYQKNVVVQVKTIQEVKVYTLVLGKFLQRDKAERFRNKVQKQYPGSFIVDFKAFN
ncbi:septal ring lytic transglycosylase RlpA family protein [Mesonia sp. HuA40]|uniref:septal ring lytic transglycosylase RlpA family protein n=1 Tax=Mesonia sp. HuA40 TaxID=2602761 RepID=UPI0011C9AEEA|nr:septal ring lytic transglycosylase RlpA family protein [Mesonia sp. HuA40]TXK70927.1 septal ring lytic transglycosylase RlpA family protein [Mesonia sp. HuA40]